MRRTGPVSWKMSNRPIKRTKLSGATRKINKPTYLTSRVSRVELKAISNHITGVVPTTGTTYALGRVEQGDEYNQRTGRAIRHVSADHYLTIIQSDQTLAASVRVVYGVWKQSKDTSNPTAGDILDLSNFTGVEYLAPLNPLNSSNMIILSDNMYSINAKYLGPNDLPAPSVLNIKKRYKHSAIQEYLGNTPSSVANWNYFQLIISTDDDISVNGGWIHYFTDA